MASADAHKDHADHNACKDMMAKMHQDTMQHGQGEHGGHAEHGAR